MEEKVTEQIIQIMVQEWQMPEDMVRDFFKDLNLTPESSIESLRESAANLLQDLVLKTK